MKYVKNHHDAIRSNINYDNDKFLRIHSGRCLNLGQTSNAHIQANIKLFGSLESLEPSSGCVLYSGTKKPKTDTF